MVGVFRCALSNVPLPLRLREIGSGSIYWNSSFFHLLVADVFSEGVAPKMNFWKESAHPDSPPSSRSATPPTFPAFKDLNVDEDLGCLGPWVFDVVPDQWYVCVVEPEVVEPRGVTLGVAAHDGCKVEPFSGVKKWLSVLVL